ncbi:Rieske 2Fe-2S domain-containing protein [Streptomyces sp. 1222.5]|uniref:Rieske 2Fe-2S domain-containing protein n=1 Tax=Streptomyces sp. 1222.5 TaxID=1881026 RepID=UPI003EC0CE71
MPHSADAPLPRHLLEPVPPEGENGLFTMSWYPICLSSEVAPGQVIGRDFLDGRVIVMRSQDGTAQVMSAYCPHLGADLSVGDMVGDTVRCAYHHWRYDRNGTCTATASGDPIPRHARLFSFPTRERFGVVWAFNGHKPLFPLPELPHPDSELIIRSEIHPHALSLDPWILCCQVPDNQHHRVVHGMQFIGNPLDNITWTDYSLLYEMNAVKNGQPLSFTMGSIGTTMFLQHGTMDGRWMGFIAGFAMPRPGTCQIYFIGMARTCEGSVQENEEFMNRVMEFEKQTLIEDAPIFNSMHFRPGTPSRSDRALVRYLEFLRKYPRAHPAAEYIR